MLDKIILEPLQPFGIKITPKESLSLTSTITQEFIEKLIKEHSVVLFRDFEAPDKETLVNYAKNMGPLLEWEFGNVMEMHAQEQPKNYLFTEGPVPFHWDGAFHKTPRYLLFQCIEAPLPNCGGETIFSNTNKIWENSTEAEKKEWKNMTLTYKTEKLAHYGGTITVPLVQTHPEREMTILRFAEPVPSTMLNPVDVSIEGLNLKEQELFLNQMASKCYSEKNCYSHTWKENDFLIADNHALIHGRNAFQEFSPRHLRRIQVL
jgi:alpha-ketoglutarate-dependent taurine dioxygenase